LTIHHHRLPRKQDRHGGNKCSKKSNAEAGRYCSCTRIRGSGSGAIHLQKARGASATNSRCCRDDQPRQFSTAAAAAVLFADGYGGRVLYWSRDVRVLSLLYWHRLYDGGWELGGVCNNRVRLPILAIWTAKVSPRHLFHRPLVSAVKNRSSTRSGER
jgi:hypothetical protein